MMRKAALPLIPLLLLLTALACGGTTARTEPTPGSLPPAGEIAPPLLGVEADVEHLSAINLGDGVVGLEQYRLSLQIGFGAGGGEQSIVVVSDQQRNPQASSSTVRLSDGDQPGGMEEISLVEQDGLLYIVWPDFGCFIQSGAANDPALNPFAAIFDPDRLLGEIQGAKLVGDVELPNGVLAAHYQFDETALVEQSGLINLNGNVYRDRELGLVVALTAVASQGALTAFGPGQPDGFQLSYELTPNQPAAINLPPACPDLRAQEPYPLLDDAYEISFADHTLIYKTNYELVEALNFYQAGMGAAGWLSVEAEDYVTETAVIVTYQRGAESVTLSILNEGDGQGTAVIVGP